MENSIHLKWVKSSTGMFHMINLGPVKKQVSVFVPLWVPEPHYIVLRQVKHVQKQDNPGV